MTLRERIHNHRRRRAFARVLRSYGIKPTREIVALGLAFEVDTRVTERKAAS